MHNQIFIQKWGEVDYQKLVGMIIQMLLKFYLKYHKLIEINEIQIIELHYTIAFGVVKEGNKVKKCLKQERQAQNELNY